MDVYITNQINMYIYVTAILILLRRENS